MYPEQHEQPLAPPPAPPFFDGAPSAPTAPVETKKSASKRTPRRTERQLLRRAANLALELTNMDATDRDLLAAVLGLNARTNTADIAAVAATSTARDRVAGTDALALLECDPIEAGITVLTLGRARMHAVWRLFHLFGAVAAEPPASDAKAATALAKAVGEDTVELEIAIRQVLDTLTR